MSEILLIMAGAMLIAGALLYGLAKSGPQQTLGGVIISVGILAVAFGGLLWSIGL
jgi:hypothetical protein